MCFRAVVREIIPVFFPLEAEQKKRQPFARYKRDGGAKQRHHNAGGKQQENNADGMSDRRYRCQITVPDSRKRHERIPEGIAEGTDRSIAVRIFRQAQNRQQPNVNKQ